MSRALGSAFTMWLALIALHAVATKGSGRIAELLGDVNSIVERVLDADVAAIPDLRTSSEPQLAHGTTLQKKARTT